MSNSKKNSKAERQIRLEIFGSPFRSFLIRKFGTIKNAAFHLDISPVALSQYIHTRSPSQEVRNQCIDLGFNASYFTALDEQCETDYENLSYDEIKFLYLEAKYLLEEKTKVITLLEERVRELQAKVFGY